MRASILIVLLIASSAIAEIISKNQYECETARKEVKKIEGRLRALDEATISEQSEIDAAEEKLKHAQGLAKAKCDHYEKCKQYSVDKAKLEKEHRNAGSLSAGVDASLANKIEVLKQKIQVECVQHH
jgi:multidrug resistance efflux pump